MERGVVAFVLSIPTVLYEQSWIDYHYFTSSRNDALCLHAGRLFESEKGGRPSDDRPDGRATLRKFPTDTPPWRR